METLFDTSHAPLIGEVENLTDGLRVVTAPNASPMTFTGTRTYILGEGEVAIIDPGPDDPAHLAAIERSVTGESVSHIIVTHSHVDHSPLATRLSAISGAPVFGFGAANAARSDLMERLSKTGDLGGGEGIDHGFAPDRLIADGNFIEGKDWKLEAVHTPGHLSNHLCFSWVGQDSLFSGDHVMGWATTLVSPPDGDLTAFMASLRKLQDRHEDTYYPGHGAVLFEAQDMLDYQLAHRLGREGQIRGLLGQSSKTVSELTEAIYTDINPMLHGAASRNVLAHLIDLYERGIVGQDGGFDAHQPFQLS